MKLSIARALALAAPLATVLGCAVAPADVERAGSSSSELSMPTVPTVPLALDPVSLCSAIPADQSMARPTYYPEIFAGISQPTRACDFSVFEVTGTMNQTLRLGLTDLVPNDKYGTSFQPLEYPYTQIPQSQCTSSYVDYVAFGWVPPKFVLSGQQVVELPGYWEAIGTEQIVHGTWGTGSGEAGPHCTFGTIEAPSNYYDRTLVSGEQTHSIVRVAVKGVASTPNGFVRGDLIVFALPQ
jgi:hypothetical protein